MTEPSSICVSIVSHGHGEEVASLLHSLLELCRDSLSQIVLTLNIPEPGLAALAENLKIADKSGVELVVVENVAPKGFGQNHNAAFAHCRSAFFCVLNPDVVLKSDPFPAMRRACVEGDSALAFPVQLTGAGTPQDYARRVPTPWDLVNRYIRRIKFVPPDTPQFVTGACMFFDADVFRTIRGFDERYFMYCEDVDICLRTQLAGKKLAVADATIIHIAHHSSRKNLRHMSWHIRSLLRLWTSAPFWKYRRKFDS